MSLDYGKDRRAAVFRWISVGFLFLFFVPTAQAQWGVHASQPDVFGNRTVAAVDTIPDGDGLVVQCNQKNTLYLAYLWPASQKELYEMSSGGSLPVTLLLKVDNGKVMKFDASMEQWNNKYGAYVASGRKYAIVEALKAMGAAQHNISVGVEIQGSQQSDNFSPIGSTYAMKVVVKDCNLNKIEPTQTPPSTGTTPSAGT